MKNKISTTKVFLLALCFAYPFVTFSQDGSLDNTFGNTGVVTTSIGNVGSENQLKGIAIQDDGKIVAAGYSFNYFSTPQKVFALTRYNINGSLDNTFHSDGIVTTSIGTSGSRANGIAIQADGKIVAAGTGSINNIVSLSDFTLTRYNTNGSSDATFGTAGIVTTSITDDGYSSANAVAIQADGKIVVAGSSTIYEGYNNYVDYTSLIRYNTNGSLDLTFGLEGIVLMEGESIDGTVAFAVALQADGKIVVAGYSVNNLGNTVFALSRHNTNGSLDNTFGTAGVITTNLLDGIANDISIQSDGKIVVAGYSSSNGPQSLFSLTRYNTNGSLDNTFGNVGIVTTSIGVNSLARGIALQTDGKIVVTGGSDNTFAVVRYNNSLTGDISEYSNISSQISIYPNPFSNTTTLKTNNLFENATFIVYNTLGEQVRKIDNITGQTFTFYRENLEQGIYFYHLKENNKMLSEDKLIICD